MTMAAPTVVTRAEVEDFLYHEAALLDEWKLKEWEALLTDDAAYYVPPNDQLAGDHPAEKAARVAQPDHHHRQCPFRDRVG